MRSRFDQVFIVTYGRSGSTNLQRLLNAIDGYHIRGENGAALRQLFQSVRSVTAAQDSVEQPHPDRKLPPSTSPDHPWYGIHDIDTTAYAQALVESFVDQVIRPPAGTRVYGFKEIRHTHFPRLPGYLDFMRKSFSNPAFVFNYRHWDDVARSRWWAAKDPDDLRERFRTFEQVTSDFAAAHPDRCIELQYEDYADNPANLRKLFDFLGEEFDLDQVTRLTSERLQH